MELANAVNGKLANDLEDFKAAHNIEEQQEPQVVPA
jgi:hypothetical protein